MKTPRWTHSTSPWVPHLNLWDDNRTCAYTLSCKRWFQIDVATLSLRSTTSQRRWISLWITEILIHLWDVLDKVWFSEDKSAVEHLGARYHSSVSGVERHLYLHVSRLFWQQKGDHHNTGLVVIMIRPINVFDSLNMALWSTSRMYRVYTLPWKRICPLPYFCGVCIFITHKGLK